MPPIILASSSPFRRELLQRLGLEFSCISPEVDESRRHGESPTTLAERLSISKAMAIAHQHPNAIVIGSDQVPAMGDTILTKPGTKERARLQLQQSSGNSVNFITGLAVTWLDANGNRQQQVETECTTVQFRQLSDDDITHYLDAEDALRCAGSFKSEGLGVSLMESMQSSDPTALIGLPLILLCKLLREAGIRLP